MLLILSHAVVSHLAFVANERVLRGSGLLNEADCEKLRLLFITESRRDPEGFPNLYEFSRAEVRALDMILTDSDPRGGYKLPDGTPTLDLVYYVWDTLIGDNDGRDGTDTDEDGLTDKNRYSGEDEPGAIR